MYEDFVDVVLQKPLIDSVSVELVVFIKERQPGSVSKIAKMYAEAHGDIERRVVVLEADQVLVTTVQLLVIVV